MPNQKLRPVQKSAPGLTYILQKVLLTVKNMAFSLLSFNPLPDIRYEGRLSFNPHPDPRHESDSSVNPHPDPRQEGSHHSTPI